MVQLRGFLFPDTGKTAIFVLRNNIIMEEKELTYEAAMNRLEKLAREMENGDIAIDQVAAKLKEAQQLLQFCKDKLTKADEEVQKLLEE
jgi:exodeoxyribonuclease VII small subunit